MQRSIFRWSRLVLPMIAVLTGACDGAQAPGPTAPSETAFNFTNGPDTAGPFVARFADRLVFYFNADERNGLMSIHIPSDVFFCGGNASFNLADIQFVTTPSEIQQTIALIQDDDGAVAIYGTADFTEAFGPGGPFSDLAHMCAFMNGPKKIAEGTARRVSALSNTAFSVSWTGTLLRGDGSRVQYAEDQTFLVNPKTGESSIPTAHIQLTPGQ